MQRVRVPAQTAFRRLYRPTSPTLPTSSASILRPSRPKHTTPKPCLTSRSIVRAIPLRRSGAHVCVMELHRHGRVADVVHPFLGRHPLGGKKRGACVAQRVWRHATRIRGKGPTQSSLRPASPSKWVPRRSPPSNRASANYPLANTVRREPYAADI